jgi:mannitol/fructose-specific phosphotransferase system IIA component (Ntr-type)
MAERASDRLGYPVVAVPPGSASSTEAVIRFLVGELVRRGAISADQADRAACRVITRERQGSTALASGVAVPHSKTDVTRPIGIIGRSAAPVPWESPGGVPVDEICLLLMPVDDPQAHLRTLENAVRVLSNKKDE